MNGEPLEHALKLLKPTDWNLFGDFAAKLLAGEFDSVAPAPHQSDDGGRDGSPGDLLVESFLVEASRVVRDVLPPRDAYVLRHRLPLDGEDHESLQMIGASLGVSRERVRQLQERGLRRIAARSASHKRQYPTGGSDPLSHLRQLATSLQSMASADVDSFLTLWKRRHPSSPPTLALIFIQRVAGTSKAEAQQTAQAATARLATLDKAWEREAISAKSIRGLMATIRPWVYWPERTRQWPRLPRRSRLRTPESSEFAQSGSFHSAKMGREVLYESGLEREFFSLLEYSDGVVEYQEQPLQMPYTYQGARHYYYPDVMFRLVDGTCVIAEVRPMHRLCHPRDHAKWRALLALSRSEGFGIYIGTARAGLAEVVNRRVPSGFEERVLRLVEQGPVLYAQLGNGLGDPRAWTWVDLAAVALRNSLEWLHGPFVLRRSERPENELTQLARAFQQLPKELPAPT